MEQSKAYIIQATNSDKPQLFAFDYNAITFGRNPSNSIDIPDRLVSRHQCVVKQVEGNQWIIEDTSSQKSTILNGSPLKGESAVINSSDVITFAHSLAKFIFYQSYELLPSTYKKRKRDDCDLDETQSKDSLVNELEKYKRLYEKTLNDIETIKAANSAMTDELYNEIQWKSQREQDLMKQLRVKDHAENLLREQISEAEAKLKTEEAANNNLIARIQELTESLKDCEEENQRLIQESNGQKHENITISEESSCETNSPKVTPTQPARSNSPVTLTEDYFDALMGMVEAKWHEKEVENLKEQMKGMVDEITDLTYKVTKRRQDLLDLIDKELLCSICSEILCNVITLNCKHSFCKTCLTEWKLKKRECPVCRTKIKNEVHPLVLDSYIDRLCEFIGEDVMTRRNEVKAERSKLPASNSDEGNNWRNRRRGNTPRRRRTAPHPFHGNPVLVYDNEDVVVQVPEAFFPINVIDLTHDSPVRGPMRRSHRIQHNNNNNPF